MDEKTKDKLKLCLAMSALLVIIIAVILTIVNYQVQGEKNMPYKLSKITIVSTAEGIQNEEASENTKWNLSIYQNNDVYFLIDKNEDSEAGVINRVAIENINITKKASVGEVKIYMPSSEEGRTFQIKPEYLVQNSLTYEGGLTSDTKKLTIGNQGGSMVVRFSNAEIGKYISAEDDEIKHDGSLIKKLGYTDTNISFEVNFDFIIEIDSIKYKANITLNLPCEGLCEKGTTSQEISVTDNIIFKRAR